MSSGHQRQAVAKMHFILPTLSWNEPLRRSLASMMSVKEARLGRIALIAPKRSLAGIREGLETLPQLAGHVTLTEETGRGVYSGFNDGLVELTNEHGYVVFLGAGDVVHVPADGVLEAMDAASKLICIPAGGDRARLRRLFGARGWLTCLPNPQGCIYSLQLGHMLRYEQRLRIYDDVVQRIAIIRDHGCTKLDCAPLITIDGHGVSGAQNLRKVYEHFRERLSLLGPILRQKEPVLAIKYVAGSLAMLARYVTNSSFNSISGNSI